MSQVSIQSSPDFTGRQVTLNLIFVLKIQILVSFSYQAFIFTHFPIILQGKKFRFIGTLNNAMREYHEVFGHELRRAGSLQDLSPLPRPPVLSDFYTPTDEQHYRELGFIALSMIGIGGVLYYLES